MLKLSSFTTFYLKILTNLNIALKMGKISHNEFNTLILQSLAL